MKPSNLSIYLGCGDKEDPIKIRSPAGLVAYLRDARARGEELPMHLDWVPEQVWPQQQPKEEGDVQAETAAQAAQTDDPAIR